MTVARPPFDPELLSALDALPLAPMDDDTDLAARRRDQDAVTPSIGSLVAGTGLECRDLTVPGPEGAPDLTLTVVRDPAAAPGPCVYFTHGGGMMFGTRSTGATAFPEWVTELGATVVSVEYRLAPEHPFPAAVEDCYAGLRWVAANAAQVGADPERIVVAGASAGGGLTAAVALLARDRGGPALVGQLLMSPMLDDRVDTVSARQFTETPAPWSAKDDVRGWTALLGDARGTADVSPYAAPARATDLSGLPSTYIEAGSAEVFRDEDVDYAARIWAAGGQAELHVFAGAYHGFQLAPTSAITREARTAQLNWMRRTLRL